MLSPQDCHSMQDLRSAIDAVDARLVALLADRRRYIDRAIELKPAEGMPARIESRVEEVVRNVRAHAAGAGLDPVLVEEMWRLLIDWSIAREEKELGV